MLGILLGCSGNPTAGWVSYSPCATGTWHGTSRGLSIALAMQASQDCSGHPPASASVQGRGMLTQGSASTSVTVAGSQQWFDLAVTLRSADSSLVASYVGQFATQDSVLGVLSCSRGCPLAVDSNFVLLKQ
jgi:hypothetical protein